MEQKTSLYVDLAEVSTDAVAGNTAARVAEEVAEARAAQAKWAAVPVKERLRLVKNARHEIAEMAVPLATEAAAVLNRPVSEKLAAEVLPLAEACRFLERNAAHLLAPRREGRRGRPVWLGGVTAEVRREPFGLVLIIGPSNYPLLLTGVQTIQALTAGNAVLLKPGPGAARTAALFAEALASAGLDPSLFRILPESPDAARAAIDAGADKVVLTGSAATGRNLLRMMAPKLIPATMELSGHDAVFVRADADVALAARAVAFGLRLNGGATCIAPRRVYVSRRIARLFEERLAKECRALPHQRFTSPRVAGLIREALDDGAHLACGELLADGVLAGPLVVAGMRAGERLLSEETFAPVVAVCAVTDDSEAVRAAGRSRYGLGASIFSTDERAAHRLAGQLDAGVVVINDMIVPTADPRIPFGGRKESGFGVTRGAEGLLDFTVTKVVSVHRGGHRPHLDQPRAGDEAIFSALIRASHARKTGGRLKGVADLIAAVRGRLTKTRN